MDQEREDYWDAPEPLPRRWTGESPMWLFLPAALLLAVLAISLLMSVASGPHFD